MQLPHGTLVNSRHGPVGLRELGESIARDGLNGYLRVSVFDRSAVRESVVVYGAGKPAMAFASDGSADRRDPDMRLMEEALRKDNAIIEICRLSEGQVKLLRDVYREFVLTPAAPLVPAPKEAPKGALKAVIKELPREAPREAPRATAPHKAEKPRAATRTEPMPEIRGRFIRAERLNDPGEYMLKYPGETGHLLFLAQLDGAVEETHFILIRGKIEAAYDGQSSGEGLMERLRGVSGQAEFYSVDEALLTSIIGRQAKAARAAAPAAPVEKAAPGIGIPAKDLLESARPPAVPVRDDIIRTVDEVSGGMEDDLAMVRRVERDFASHVDDLLCKLELSHLRARKKR